MKWFLCAAALALLPLQAQNYEPGKGVNFYSREKELALGQSLAREVRRNTTALADPDADARVHRIAAKLAAQLRGGWDYQIAMVQDDLGGATHEPVSLAGGFLFVPRQLLSAAQSDDELAGMMAHAMAHVVARHATRQATKTEMMQIAWQPLGEMPAQPGQSLTVPMGLLSFQRSNEKEADYLAVKALTAAGYNPEALAVYVERTQPPDRERDKVFSPLPDKEARVAALRAAIGKQ